MDAETLEILCKRRSLSSEKASSEGKKMEQTALKLMSNHVST